MTKELERPEDLGRIVGDPAEPSFVVDLDGRVVALNDLAGELLGVGPSVATGSQRSAPRRTGSMNVTARTRTPGGSPRRTRPRANLSQREWQVLRLLADGLTTRQVAERLGIAYTTARNYAQHILEKLGAPNRIAALTRVLDVPGFATMDEWLAEQGTRDGDSSDPVADAASSRGSLRAGLVPRATRSRSLSSTPR
jgi:DNA-binding CsgD family transcriptional regulator